MAKWKFKEPIAVRRLLADAHREDQKADTVADRARAEQHRIAAQRLRDAADRIAQRHRATLADELPLTGGARGS